MKLRSQADAIAPDKYAALQNVRANSDQELQTRPGYALAFDTLDLNAVTDIKAYTRLGTDGKPRFLARNAAQKIYLDTGALVDTLAGSGSGVSMIPFRPRLSEQTWMYITNGGDYRKLSAPDAGGSVTAQKVGIAEPQSVLATPTINTLDAATDSPTITVFNALAASWTPGGTAGATANGNLLTDTVGAAVLSDPAVPTRKSAQVTIQYYSPGMLITVNAGNTYPVEEVWKPAATCNITAIRYYSGVSGKCMIVPSKDIGDTIGRGSLITLNSLGVGGAGAETVLVLSVIKGLNGTSAFECSTAGTQAAGGTVVGVLAIVIHGTIAPADAITMPVVTSTITAGTGTMSQTIAATDTYRNYSKEDYIHVTLLLNNIKAVTTVKLIFNIGSSPPDFGVSVLTFTVTGASLASRVLAGQVLEIHFPMSALNGSLEFVNGFRLELVTADTCVTSIGGLWVGGTGAPDIGEAGEPYRYRAVPRSSLTGAKGNPSPDMRIGVMPRRQTVTVKTSSLSFTDTQVDLLDVFRIGGSLTSFRYAGTVAIGADFSDKFFDDSLTAADPLEINNFEPWPTIDIPFKVTAGGGTTITVIGTWITVSGAAITWPLAILSWLPGTLIALTGIGTFTLRSRPLSISATSYLFEIEEEIGSASPGVFSVLEPNIARQILPYLWGPDEQGTIFGVGDPLRPGTLYFAKAFNPDSASDKLTIELSSPSEPLMGGEMIGGISLVSSTDRWWAIYPSFTGAVPYTKIPRDVGRALAAPRGICTDGQRIYFWAKDCIAATAGGLYEDLSSEDLYPIFPHEGVAGNNVVRAGVTFYAPDYSRLATFRLCVADKMIFADYQDSTGAYRTLVCDLRTGSWFSDSYANVICVHYPPEQQKGALTTAPAAYELLVMGDTLGKVWKQKDNNNDNATGISAVVGTFEWNGGDLREQPQFGDMFLDCIAPPGLSAQPVSNGASVGAPTAVPASGARQFAPISLAGQSVQKFLGLKITWTDDFSVQSSPTQLVSWQASLVRRPEITKDRFGDWAGSMAGD